VMFLPNFEKEDEGRGFCVKRSCSRFKKDKVNKLKKRRLTKKKKKATDGETEKR